MRSFNISKYQYPCQVKQQIEKMTHSILLRKKKVDQLTLKLKKFEKEIKELEQQQDALFDKMDELLPLKYQKRSNIAS